MTEPGSTGERGVRHAHIRARLRRVLLVLVAIEVLIGLVVVSWWLLGVGPFRDDALRGSVPPGHQHLPDLSAMGAVTPPHVPTRNSLRGHAVALAVTCIECPSGEVLGGFLGRMGVSAIPKGAKLITLTWGGDPGAWTKQQHVPGRWQRYSLVPPISFDRIARTLHVGQSGEVMLYDKHGRWRSTYPLGLLNVDDIPHDLGVLERE